MKFAFTPSLRCASLALGLLLAACSIPTEQADKPANVAVKPAIPVEDSVAPPPPATKDKSQQRATGVMELAEVARSSASGEAMVMAEPAASAAAPSVAYAPVYSFQPAPQNTEKYQRHADNPVKLTRVDALSTLSLDVDTGSYSNVRRFLNQGQLPPKDAVRIEEMVNYFRYSEAKPLPGHPFAVQTEVAIAPWNRDHLLLRVGVKAVDVKAAAMPSANLVFLVDVSGSMDQPDKLPLVQASLKMLTARLRPQDHVALVVYAGRTALELPATPGDQKEKILAAIARLQAGGSTAGESALKMAYAQARAGYIKGGINRILLATDGDFNVGVSDIEQLKSLIERERESGISLTTLGFGQGNYQDAMMQELADIGNGNYSYIDSLSEAKKVLVEEMSATFNTVAKDVKIQLEFNPAQIAEWRLIGYEKRVLREEDFRNDKVDAGEIGAGKTVTALYELTPVGAATLHSERRYDAAAPMTGDKTAGDKTTELGFLRIRYKQPEGSQSTELAQTIARPDAAALTLTPSADLRFASAVAAFGQLLRQSPYTGAFSYADVKALAVSAAQNPASGVERGEFIKLVDLAAALTPAKPETNAATHDRSSTN
ncbi:MAG: VWA domain-containing protein [Azonexus sp.]|jgi:Ca-activated chloride channel family protein|nr:VWA domain-containing protein [Azonexus sp.]